MLRFRGKSDLARVSQAMRRAPGNIRRELKEGLEAAPSPAVRDLKAATRVADVHGERVARSKVRRRRANGKVYESPIRRFVSGTPSLGLRGPMARAIEADISTSGTGARADIRLREGSVPPRIRRLVKYVLGSAKRWRHPVMGRKSRWVGQNAPGVWWPTLKPHLPRFAREVEKATRRAEEQLQREAG
jgi:hypothetical protein